MRILFVVFTVIFLAASAWARPTRLADGIYGSGSGLITRIQQTANPRIYRIRSEGMSKGNFARLDFYFDTKTNTAFKIQNRRSVRLKTLSVKDQGGIRLITLREANSPAIKMAVVPSTGELASLQL